MPVGDPRSRLMPEVSPTMQFDVSRAMRYFPQEMLLFVRIVEKPDDAVSVIESELFGPETFYGTYVMVRDAFTDEVVGHFGHHEFLRRHPPVEGIENGWIYTDPVDAYQADTEGELFIVRVGGIQHVNVGDWILRHRDYTVRCISDEDFTRLYDLGSARPIPEEPE
jgi:hypothetical protein